MRITFFLTTVPWLKPESVSNSCIQVSSIKSYCMNTVWNMQKKLCCLFCLEHEGMQIKDIPSWLRVSINSTSMGWREWGKMTEKNILNVLTIKIIVRTVILPFPGFDNLWYLPGKLQQGKNNVVQHAAPEKQKVSNEHIQSDTFSTNSKAVWVRFSKFSDQRV